MKKVCMVGTGYVGLVTGACFEHLGHQVICVDTDKQKIQRLNDGHCPIYEEGLEELLKNATRLSFSDNLAQALKESEIVFICVGTPEKEDGNADLTYVFDACQTISDNLREGQTVVIKSTAPVTAVPKVKEILDQANIPYNLVSNPEFLAQGTAVKDFLNPDRVVIGSNTDDGFKQVGALYENVNAPIIKTDVVSAILAKYAANAFLATKVSFINSIARLCEAVGANVTDVATGMGYDKRIGNRFLNAGVGYGGSCFPKDTKALIKTGEDYGVNLDILKVVDEVNVTQRQIVLAKLKKHLGQLKDKNICLLGLAFKPGTDDLREAPALYLAKELINENSNVKAYDPIVKKVTGFDGQLSIVDDLYEAAHQADAIILVTEHPSFVDIDFEKIKAATKGNVIIDGRNLLNGKALCAQGFVYEGIGV